MGIQVKATQTGKSAGQTVGFDGMQRRREGDVFMLEDKKWKEKDGNEHVVSAEQQFAKSWMKKVSTKKHEEEDEEADEPRKKHPAPHAPGRVHDKSQI